MKPFIRLLLLVPIAFGAHTDLRADSNESFLGRVKDFLAATPTPAPARKKKSSKKNTPTPTPTPRRKSSPRPKASPSPTPAAKRTPSPTPTPTPEPSVSPSPPAEETPTPTPSPSVTPRHKQLPSPTPSARPKSSASPSPVKSGTAPVTIAPSEIVGYDKNPPAVRRLLDLGLELTSRNLTYKYGSADPASGGMDCSGFVYYVLKQNGMKDPPRDAREQYVWVRKAGKFQAVLGRSQDTFELDALKPGDLLFWAGTYNVDRDPAITHTMIYLGREKTTNQRVMIGASDGRTYKGQSRYGVSVFDFKIAGRKMVSANEPGPTFVGYASIPGIEENAQRSEPDGHKTSNAERSVEEGNGEPGESNGDAPNAQRRGKRHRTQEHSPSSSPEEPKE